MGTWAEWVDKNFIVLGICCALTAGLLYPPPGEALHDVKLGSCVGLGEITIPKLAVVVIFLVSGLGLDSPSQSNKPKPLALGVLFVLFVTPLLCIPIMKLPAMGIDVNITLLQGMSLFCAVPTTLASGVTMVRQANGNVPLAILLTTLTNILGVFTMPYSISWIFQAAVSIKPTSMMNQLVLQTLVPLSLGMLCRRFVAPLQRFATAYKKSLSRSQNCCIFLTVWIMTSDAQKKIVTSPPQDLLACLLLAIVVHLIYRCGAYYTGNFANLPSKEWVTFVLMCSQKSLPVCVSVISALPAVVRKNSGVLIVPCIMSHFSQLVIDGILAVRWQVKEAPLLG